MLKTLISLNVFNIKFKDKITYYNIMSEIIQKKRGRKPKNYNIIQAKIDTIHEVDELANTDEEKIIFHLPITIDEINNFDNINNINNINSLNINDDNIDTGIFIKTEKNINSKLNIKKNSSNNDSDSTESLKTSINTTNFNQISAGNSIHKIATHNLIFTQNTKCWWCRNCFNTPSLELPEDYYNDTFFCTGNYCSFNCMKKYNLELNDSLTWKRDSLINLFYFKLYNEYKEINPAPHWMILKEYGGCLTLDEFRNNFIVNAKEYIILHPPLISRQMQIEESYRFNKLKEVPIDKLNKIYSEIDSDYAIRRNKPIQSDQLNLEKTMGLIKKKKPFKM